MEKIERLFLGVHLYPLFKDEIDGVVVRLREIYPEHKWVNLAHIHFTIHFLGDVAVSRREKIEAIAREVAGSTKPFPVRLAGMGAFPGLENPRVVWIGASPGSQADLAALHDRVARPLIAQGFPAEHEVFTPHATLFRVRADSPIIWDHSTFEFLKTPAKIIDRLTLFESVLTSSGSEYQPREEFLFEASGHS